jgi:hypothetical protein
MVLVEMKECIFEQNSGNEIDNLSSMLHTNLVFCTID